MLTDHEKDLLLRGAQLLEPHVGSQGGLDYCYYVCPWCDHKEFSDDYEDVFSFNKDAPDNLNHEINCELIEYQALIKRLTS